MCLGGDSDHVVIYLSYTYYSKKSFNENNYVSCGVHHLHKPLLK